jgi:hypothetical protein
MIYNMFIYIYIQKYLQKKNTLDKHICNKNTLDENICNKNTLDEHICNKNTLDENICNKNGWGSRFVSHPERVFQMGSVEWVGPLV